MVVWKSKKEMVKAFSADGDAFKEDFEVISPYIKGDITKAIMLCSETQEEGENEVTEFMEVLIDQKTPIFNYESKKAEDCYNLYLIEEEHLIDFNKKKCCFCKYILTMNIPGMSTLIIIETEERK